MTTHTLKTWATAWEAIRSGEKTFEVRRNDRFFQRGDTVRLVWQEDGNHTYGVDYNRILVRRIGWTLQGGQFGIEPGYCVFALEPIEGAAP